MKLTFLSLTTFIASFFVFNADMAKSFLGAKLFLIEWNVPFPNGNSNTCAKDTLFQRIVFDQAPDPAGAGPRAETAADAEFRIDRIFIGLFPQILPGDRVLRADGLAEAAVAAGAAGGA